MTKIQTYPKKKGRIRSLIVVWGCLLVLISGIFFSVSASAQSQDEYEEFLVTINVQRIGSAEIPAIIHGQELFLPAKDLFDFLKIKNTISPGLDSISGFFIDSRAKFLIDKTSLHIQYHDEVFAVKRKDFYRTDNNLYLKSDYFGKIFGLVCKYDFRSLSVNLETKIELPAIREMQLELMRRNMSQLKGDRKADTSIKRKFSWLNLGTMDWAVSHFQRIGGTHVVRADVALGAVIAGGEADAYFNVTSNDGSIKNLQYFRWRYVDNKNPVVKQVTAGQLFTQSISTLDGPVTGLQVTNNPTTYRRSFGTYRLSDKTEPDWMVELYVNGVLVNYVKADASGFFTFEVPLVYGNSAIKLRFYSPWGEERLKEVNINIPFNFMPVKQFEYTLTAGIINDKDKSKFTRGSFNYGLNKHITIGGGAEYLSTGKPGNAMPFLNASVMVGSKLMLSGEHAYGVRSKGLISYRMPANVQLDINYTRFNKTQTAVRFNYLEESKIVLSMPLRSGKFSSFSRLSINQYKQNKVRNTTAEFLFSSIFAGLSSNFTTFAEFTKPGNPLISSNLAITFRLPARIRITPQALYEYRQKKLTIVRCELEKSIFNQGFINLSYQRDLLTNVSFTGIGIRYNFGFAQTSVSSMHSKVATTVSQAARGSVMFSAKTGNISVNSQTSVGKGGLIILPYLDLNCNGKRDEGEPKASGVNLRINGGRTEHNKRDTAIIVTGLEAYNTYFIELDNKGFETIAWQLKNKSISIMVEPNNFKVLELPIAVLGEVSGFVQLKGEKGLTGQGRVIVNIYDHTGNLAGRTMSESDGYFSYMGLAPGNYTASVDPTQCQKLNMTCPTGKINFTIKPNRDGDVVEGIEFTVTIP